MADRRHGARRQGGFFGFNRPGATPSQGLIDAFWMQGMMAGHKNAYDCIKAFSETDFTEDLRKFDAPHGLADTHKEQVHADRLN